MKNSVVRTSAKEFVECLRISWAFWTEICGNEAEALRQDVMKNEIKIRLPFLDNDAKEALREFGKFLLENVDEPKR